MRMGATPQTPKPRSDVSIEPVNTRFGWKWGLLLALTTSLLGACASKQMTLGNRFSPEPGATTGEAAQSGACVMLLGAVTDERANPGEIANLYESNIRHENITDWLHSGLLSLKRQGIRFETREAGDAPPALPELDVALIKAYVQPLSTSKSANLVVRVRVVRNGEVASERLYRGRDTGMNWWGSQDEMETAFNLALRDLLSRLAPDLRSQCG